MKITRQRTGYRINLSDGEFEALEFLVQHGQADCVDEDLTHLSNSARRALRTGRFSLIASMHTDVDRR